MQSIQKKLRAEWRKKINAAPYAAKVDGACVAELNNEQQLDLGREHYAGLAPVVIKVLEYGSEWLRIQIKGSFVANGFYRIPAQMFCGKWYQHHTGYGYFDNHHGISKWDFLHTEFHTKF